MERQTQNESGRPLAIFLLRALEFGESVIRLWINNADFSDTEASLRAQARPSQTQNNIPDHFD